MGDKMWFGTRDAMQWIPAPHSGAQMDPTGWGEGGTLLNGGGYQAHSWGTHKVYTYSWGESAPIGMAQLLKSYRDGTYGRGLIYFIDPLAYPLNVLPARLADPSMAVGNESATLVPGVEPTGAPTAGWQANSLPVTAAVYDLRDVPGTWPGESAATFIPVPAGHTLHLGAFYSFTGGGKVFVRPELSPGVLGASESLTALAPNATAITPHAYTDVHGVWVWVGKSLPDSTITLRGLVGRIAPKGQPAPKGPWIGGMGHSGCRFAGEPTWAANTGVGGGQIGVSASFREVGSWLYA